MPAETRDPERLDVFAHGVASGDPLPDRVIVWTRVTTAARDVDVRWTVALDEDLEDVVVSGRTRTGRARDHTVKIDVTGLEPATTYWYAFEAEGARSRVGRTRTAPVGPVERLRLAFCSCAKYNDGWFNTYGRIADRDDLDVVVHLGDYIYEYGDEERSPGKEIGRGHVPPHECRTLDDYRTRYALARLDPDCQNMHARHPTVHVFDDHEFANDVWREGAKAHDPTTDGPWSERAREAFQTWYEWLPVRRPDPDDHRRIYRRLPFGDLVDLLMIDCRTWRDEQIGSPALYDDERVLLGPDQHDWLVERLRGSEAMWKLVGNPIMVGQCYTQMLPDWLGAPLAELGILTSDEHAPKPDQWDGYPAARSRLFTTIRANQIRNVVFLSGDVHSGWAVHLREDPADQVQPLAVEFVTSSITSQNLNEKVGDEQRTQGKDVEQTVMRDNPHVEWCEFDDHGYVLLDVTPERIRSEWWSVDTVLERSDGEHLKSAWEVREGTARLYHVGGERVTGGTEGRAADD